MWDASNLVRADWFAGARVVLVLPDGQSRVLSEGFHSACDPDVSFDATHLLFSGKKDPNSPWRVYEVGLDGQGLRPVTQEDQEARTPIYLSTLFTLDSPEPWYTIAYVGREIALSQVVRPRASSLYNIKLDGTETRRLTYTPNHSFDPIQMSDGRLVYAAERYPLEPDPRPGRVRLFAVHIEGADAELYAGDAGCRIQHMPCSTASGLVVFVESEQLTPDGAGQLACVTESRPHVTYKRLTENPAWLYLHPSPLRGSRVLVSRRPADGHGTCGIFSFDCEGLSCEPVFDSLEHHDVQAKLVLPRSRPDGHSTVVDTKAESGVFYGLNCYDADDLMRPHLTKGSVKSVRFIEGVLQSAAGMASSISAGPAVARRLIGEAPVEADGSFNVEVPASTPILLQTLDERGLALATCGWIWVQPKETRGCIGCHEDPELAPENTYVFALRRPSNRLTLPPDKRRTVTFRDDVAPILRNQCALADCHGGSDIPLRIPLSAHEPSIEDILAAYDAILAPADGSGNSLGSLPRRGKYVDAGRARTSWFVWQLMGADVSRPWDRHSPRPLSVRRKVSSMPPLSKGIALDDRQIRTIVQWIDLGATFAPAASAASSSTSPGEVK